MSGQQKHGILFRVKNFRPGKKLWAALVVFTGLLTWYHFSLPSSLFNDAYCTVLDASNGQLLSASIATDGQWRFPQTDSLPDKFVKALVTFEDKRFFDHQGVDLLSMGRAIRQNIAAGKIISGGSTITMQVIRLSRKEKSRSIVEKIIESILATRLELRYSKREILNLYSSHAPFGGNVVGLDAACWRYFGTDSRDLSWAQAAMLAVLPNSPSLIHPGKNRETLRSKRDRLLRKLRENNFIDEFTCGLALEEEIPEKPHALPKNARHLLLRAAKNGFGERRILSTIDVGLQIRVEQILSDHHERLKGNQIHNGAAVVLDVKSGNVLAYCGNVDSEDVPESAVDIISAPRSTGSILKPFLFAAMMDEGKLLPSMLLPDVPLVINGFAPKNFSHAYDGAVPADKALIRSLNVPAVNLLQHYRYEKLHSLLSAMGMSSLSNPPEHYGLSLILGGAEASLWDVSGMYASMARTLNNYFEHPGERRYFKSDFHAPRFISKADTADLELQYNSWLSASSIYLTFSALTELHRPGEETGWRYFSSAKKIAWKTGTSFGFRDAWAVGVTPEFVVGVWIGNADGEGRPGLTGTDAAAPLMFDIFSNLPGRGWFQQPTGEMQQVVTCKKSGYRISERCSESDTIWVPKAGLASGVCPFHKKIHLTRDHKYQVHDQCASINEMIHENWFVLPPVQEHYYKAINLSYKTLPSFRYDCADAGSLAVMDMVYPKNNARIFIPREIDGSAGSSIFELAHRNPGTTVFWHLDGKYVGSTRSTHHIALNPGEGKHTLTAVDDEGKSIERSFVVISKM
jgi:penicillin-binding protein 1C